MDFQALLEREHSKALTAKIVKEVCENPQRMDELIHLLLHAENRIKQRASWPISFIAQRHPWVLTPHLPVLVDMLAQKDNHPAINRNILRALQYIHPLPEECRGKALTYGFDLLNDPDQPIAVKAFSMTVLFNISKEYHEIRNELRLSIEEQMVNGSAGIKSRGKKILKAI